MEAKQTRITRSLYLHHLANTTNNQGLLRYKNYWLSYAWFFSISCLKVLLCYNTVSQCPSFWRLNNSPLSISITFFFLIPLSVSGMLGCVHLLTLVNNAANTGVHKWINVYFSLVLPLQSYDGGAAAAGVISWPYLLVLVIKLASSKACFLVLSDDIWVLFF